MTMNGLSNVQANIQTIKCVLLGDGAVGKTSLIVSYTTNGYPSEYVPTAFDNYSVVVGVNGAPVQLQLCDTAGQDDFDALRPLCYPGTDVFLVCFSVVSPASFHNVRHKWVDEVRRFSPVARLVLVGLQCDLRTDVKVLLELAKYGEKPVTEKEGRAEARAVGATSYFECSALTQKNLKEVFDALITLALARSANDASGRRVHGGKARGGSLPKTPSSDSSNKTLSTGYSYGSTQCISVMPGSTAPSANKTAGAGWRKLCCLA